MKAAQFNSYGGTDTIEIKENAVNPIPSSNQILVEVHAASINPVESAIRNGYMAKMLALNFPATVGGDFSGTVKAVGDGVTEFKTGDLIYGIGNQFKGGTGGVAEYVCAEAVNSGIKPTSIDNSAASSLPLVGTSALQALEEHINISEGQKILIHGGAGGIGTLAIQIAKMHGAHVTTTAGGDSAVFLKSLGADEVIDYKTQDFSTVLHDYDAVFDTVGGETTDKSISILRKGGILVSMAGQANEDLVKQQEITAITQMTKGDTTQLKRLAELVDQGKIKSVVDSSFPLSETKAAYDLLETGHPEGKIVITIK